MMVSQRPFAYFPERFLLLLSVGCDRFSACFFFGQYWLIFLVFRYQTLNSSVSRTLRMNMVGIAQIRKLLYQRYWHRTRVMCTQLCREKKVRHVVFGQSHMSARIFAKVGYIVICQPPRPKPCSSAESWCDENAVHAQNDTKLL